MAITDLPMLSMLRTKMQWHQERQRVLAENVSNSDTPNFRPRDLVELALAHAIESKTEGAYRRGDALERRRAMMTAWSTFIGHPRASTPPDSSAQSPHHNSKTLPEVSFSQKVISSNE